MTDRRAEREEVGREIGELRERLERERRPVREQPWWELLAIVGITLAALLVALWVGG